MNGGKLWIASLPGGLDTILTATDFVECPLTARPFMALNLVGSGSLDCRAVSVACVLSSTLGDVVSLVMRGENVLLPIGGLEPLTSSLLDDLIEDIAPAIRIPIPPSNDGDHESCFNLV